jgi:hypothetical protein
MKLFGPENKELFATFKKLVSRHVYFAWSQRPIYISFSTMTTSRKKKGINVHKWNFWISFLFSLGSQMSYLGLQHAKFPCAIGIFRESLSKFER